MLLYNYHHCQCIVLGGIFGMEPDRSLESKLMRMVQQFEGMTSEVRSLMSTVSGTVARLEEEVSRLRENDQTQRNEIKRLEALMKATLEPLNGIIAQLTRQCGGNVHDKGIVAATGSPLYKGGAEGHLCKYAADLGTDPAYASEIMPNAWISYDFKQRRVTPTSYSIRTGCYDFPRSWVLEGSNSGGEGSWKIIDRRDNSFDLNGPFVTRNFQISPPPNESFCFIRLRQTGNNHHGRELLALTSFEILGTLSEQ